MLFNPNQTYTLSEIRSIIKESATPVVGKNVVNDDKKNNKKAVTDILNNVSKTMPETPKKDVAPQVDKDLNKTTLDAQFAYEPGKDYKERVKAQAEGYYSEDNKKTSTVKDDDSLDTKGNENFYKERKAMNKEQDKIDAEGKHAGLKSHNMSPELYKSKSVFVGEGKKMKRLHFKNTEFLNEQQVYSRIPDEYKYDGNKFVMMDKAGTEYLIECKRDNVVSNYIHVDITNSVNLKKIDESISRMKELADYKSSDFNKTSTFDGRKKTDQDLNEMVSRVKTLVESQEKKKNPLNEGKK